MAFDTHAIAATLIEALPYMRRFSGSTFVVKYGGHAMGDESVARDFARDIQALHEALRAKGAWPSGWHGCWFAACDPP